MERLEKGNIQLLGDDDAEFLFSLARKGLDAEARITNLEFAWDRVAKKYVGAMRAFDSAEARIAALEEGVEKD